MSVFAAATAILEVKNTGSNDGMGRLPLSYKKHERKPYTEKFYFFIFLKLLLRASLADGVPDREDDAESNYACQNDGVAALPQTNFLHKVVDDGKSRCCTLKL